MISKRKINLIIASIFVFTFSFLSSSIFLKTVVYAEKLPNVNWRMQCAYPPPENLFPGIPGAYGQAVKFAEMVEKATNGKFRIQVFPGGSIFKTPQLFDGVRKGSIEMGYAAPIYWGGKIPEAAVEFGLPGHMVTYQQAKKLIWGTEWLSILRKNYKEHNIYLLADTEISQYNLISNFPCNNASDLRGKKIRATGIIAKAVKLWGGTPVNIEPSEIYVALQRGTIDGAMYPAYSGITYKLFEVANYVSWPGMVAPDHGAMIANMDAYSELPQAYKDALNEQAEKWSKWCFNERGPQVDGYVQKTAPEEYGTEMIHLTPGAIKEFEELSSPLWDNYREKSEDCAKLLDLMLKAKKF